MSAPPDDAAEDHFISVIGCQGYGKDLHLHFFAFDSHVKLGGEGFIGGADKLQKAFQSNHDRAIAELGQQASWLRRLPSISKALAPKRVKRQSLRLD
jgi:hypothetical protein